MALLLSSSLFPHLALDFLMHAERMQPAKSGREAGAQGGEADYADQLKR